VICGEFLAMLLEGSVAEGKARVGGGRKGGVREGPKERDGPSIHLSKGRRSPRVLLRYTYAGDGAGEVTRGEAGRREGRGWTRIQNSAGGMGGYEWARR